MPTRRSVKGEKIAKIATKKSEPTISSEGSAASLQPEAAGEEAKAAAENQAAAELSASGEQPVEQQAEPGEEKPAKKPSSRPSVAGKRTAKRPNASKSDAEEGDDAPEEGDEASAKKGKVHRRSAKDKKPLTLGRKIALAVGGIVLAFVLFAVGVSLDRWALHDDEADLQDAWYVYDSLGAVVITENTIGLLENTNYKYTLDTTAKTIHYTIGNLSGDSHYRFSADRNTVALIEDGKQVFTATLFDDLGWWIAHLGDMITGKTVLPANPDDNVMMLQRKSVVDAILAEEEARAKAEAEAKAKAEAEAKAKAEAEAAASASGSASGAASDSSASKESGEATASADSEGETADGEGDDVAYAANDAETSEGTEPNEDPEGEDEDGVASEEA